MKLYATLALSAAMTVGAGAAALAQAIPPGQSCGGLLCDIGVFGRKVPVNADGTPLPPQEKAAAVAAAEANDPHRLPCRDFLCRAFGQKDADAAPPPPPPVAAAEPAPPEPAKPAKKTKKKRIAKAAAPAQPAAQ